MMAPLFKNILLILFSVFPYLPAFSQICPSGSDSGRPTSRFTLRPGQSGGHVEASEQGGGVLQPGPAVSACGGDAGAAR